MGLRSLVSRNVGAFLVFQMSLLFGAFSPDFTNCADTRSIGDGIFATETRGRLTVPAGSSQVSAGPGQGRVLYPTGTGCSSSI